MHGIVKFKITYILYKKKTNKESYMKKLLIKS